MWGGHASHQDVLAGLVTLTVCEAVTRHIKTCSLGLWHWLYVKRSSVTSFITEQRACCVCSTCTHARACVYIKSLTTERSLCQWVIRSSTTVEIARLGGQRRSRTFIVTDLYHRQHSTVVMTCCKGDGQSQWKTPYLAPHRPATL